MDEKYKYSPLSPREIRLLYRLPKQNLLDDAPKFQMRHVSLDDNSLRFVALSYTWGDLTRKIPISMDNRSFHVYENVHQVLSDVEPNVNVWIDAICINQDDNDDKSQQIPLMGDIYSKAVRVAVWLGPAADNSDFAISFLSQLREVLPTISATDIQEKGFRSQLERKTNSKLGDWKWLAVNKLLQRAWFTRIWVVQEVALSTGAVVFGCGDGEIGWHELVEVLEGLRKHNALAFVSETNPKDDDPLGNLATPIAVRQIWLILSLYTMRKNESLGLEEAIQLCNICKSTDPRDKIYALYGLASVEDSEIAANYNNTVQEVYLQVTRHLMRKNHSLALLSDAGISFGQRVPSIPSWIPNLNAKRISSRLGQHSDRSYMAGGESKPVFHWKANSDNLFVRGCLADSVAQQTSKFPTVADGYQNMLSNFFREVILIVEQNLVAMDATVKESLMRTLVADRDINMRPLGSNYMDFFDAFIEYQQQPEMYKEGFDYKGIEGVDPVKDKIHQIATSAQAYKMPIVNCLPGRRFCITTGGRMGLVPSDTKAGDIIGIFHGSTVPMVLRISRDVDDGGLEGVLHDGKFILVGESYVHGLMAGEGLELAKDCDIIIQ